MRAVYNTFQAILHDSFKTEFILNISDFLWGQLCAEESLKQYFT